MMIKKKGAYRLDLGLLKDAFTLELFPPPQPKSLR